MRAARLCLKRKYEKKNETQEKRNRRKKKKTSKQGKKKKEKSHKERLAYKFKKNENGGKKAASTL